MLIQVDHSEIMGSKLYGNGYFIAVGINGTLLTSYDGVTWSTNFTNISQTLYGAAYGNSIYVAVGGGGVALSSSNGTNWTQRSSGTSQALHGVTYGGNRFVAVGGNGVILSSSNGINWTSRTSSINVDLLAAAYGNGVYAAMGNNGKILTSSDGVYWDSQTSGVRGNLSGAAFGNLRFVAVGVGEIIYSKCNQTAAAVNVVNNEKFLQGPGSKKRISNNEQGTSNIEGNFPLRHSLFDIRYSIFYNPPGRRRQEINENIDVKASLNLVSPNGDETLQAGEKFLITWKSESEVEKVKLEYSPDNGTTYLPIAVDVDNAGHYEWMVPHHITAHCLVRVSEVKERKMPPHGLVYEMDFIVNGIEFPGKGDIFTIYLGDAADETIKNNLPLVSFSREANGKVYVRLNDQAKEVGRFTGFSDRWHNIRIFMDNVYDRISVILDGKLIFESVPRSSMAYFSPALSFAVGPGNANNVEIDNVSVSAFYSFDGKPQWMTLFNEDFLQLKEKNSMVDSGWRIIGERILECDQTASVLKTLSIQPAEDMQVMVIKAFNIPVDFPFDISDKTFEIRYNNDMFSDSTAYDIHTGHGGSGNGVSASDFYSPSSASLSNSTPGISRTSELFNTYYIYTFDGKLLAEYDHNGSCVRDYIYAGNRLIAEYKPQTSEYFYYMTDQISSTRIITNSSGNVVFSEAYGPYGDVQKTWTNTYDPKMKFSGKEREGYSDLDYFGARYFDHKSYRFNSVDPVINKKEALYNPQLWNLYAYCNNNPITYYDPDGRLILVVPWLLNPATIAAITAAATAGAIATHNLVKSIDVDEVVEDVIEVDMVVVKTGLDILSSGLSLTSTNLSKMLKKDDAENPEQMKKLGKGEIKKLKDAGVDIHELKGGGKVSRGDLFKNKKGDIFVKPKSGKGPGDPTGININDF